MTIADYLVLAAINGIRHSPILIIGVVGLWLSASRRYELANTYVWAARGFALLVVHSLLGVVRDVASTALQVNWTQFAQSRSGIGWMLSLLSFVAYLPLLLALVFLARAILLDRANTLPRPSRIPIDRSAA